MYLSDEFFADDPYSWKKNKKHSLLIDCFNRLNNYHYKNCIKYKRIIDSVDPANKVKKKLDELPYLPVNIFKTNEFITGSKKNIFKTLHSSGTSGQDYTKIFLSRDNAILQTKVLSKIVSSFIGSKRLPMLAIDSSENYRKNTFFSARSAAIRGFSIFSNSITFALKKDSSFNKEVVQNFFRKNNGQKVIIFGFTYSVYKDFLLELEKVKLKYKFPSGILIHGGGWKKMLESKVSSSIFKKKVQNLLNITKIHNYYGLVEQTGSIYIECEKGNFHCSNFSDIIVRKETLGKAVFNKKGMVQLLSPLAISYPGHNILTEDLGKIIGEDNCSCGRMGKYFKIYGRLEKAEIRGCSDVSP